MKGIVLAGGSGTRLYPITRGQSKQQLQVYDKPMIYYPVSVLMLAGIRDILIITTPDDQESFKKILGNGERFGVNFKYAIQPEPKGLAQAFTIGEEFIKDDTCAMVLGDNIFYGNGFVELLKNVRDKAEKGMASIFCYDVKDPERFGIAELDNDNNVISVEEKPKNPKSSHAITGLYFYPKGVAKNAKLVKPSLRGEVEITTLNDIYLKENKLRAEVLGGGYTWFDTGTFDSMLDASCMIRAIQNNRGMIISCLEQIGYKNGWINDESLEESAKLMAKNDYGKYLQKVLDKKRG